MTDTYSTQPATRGPRFRGMRRRRINPQTGQEEREVWVQGQGYLPEGAIGALAEEDQSWLQSARGGLSTARLNARLGEQFLTENRRPRRSLVDAGGETGGTAALPVPEWSGLQNPTRQRMEGLTNQMVRANIREGQAGTMNSIIEQMLARQQYPTTSTDGNVNGERIVQMMVDEAEMTAMVREAEAWAREHRGLQGFEVHWTDRRSDRVRQEAEQAVRRRLRLPGGQARSQTRQGGGQGITIDADGRRIP